MLANSDAQTPFNMAPVLRLDDHVLVVSGAGSGINAAIAIAAHELGARVMVLDRNPDGIEATLAAVGDSDRIQGHVANVRSTADVDGAVAATVAAFGGVTSLVCGAGYDRGGTLDSVTDEHFDDLISTNLGGTFRLIRAVLPHMLASTFPNRAIVAISSAAAKVAIPQAGVYSATKAGQAALIRNVALDHSRAGIRANSLLVGSTETPLMWANVPDEEITTVRKAISEEVLLGRLAEPREIASAACWLLSPASSYVTGSEVPVDGGILATCVVDV